MHRLLAMFIVAAPVLAQACPTCSCANPALTAMGSEQPFANRVRLAATMRGWQQDQGEASVDVVRLRELRLDLTGSWSPTAWLVLAVRWFGVRAGADVRADAPAAVGTRLDSSLAGVLGSVLLDVVFSLGSQVVLLAGARMPLLDSRPGPVRTWPLGVMSVVVDL